MATHSNETRLDVLNRCRDGESYRDIEAATGVSKSTVARWAETAGIESPNADQTEAAAEKNRLTWLQRRGDLVDQLGVVAAELLEKARKAPARDAQALMTAVAIGVDKAQLLSGGVTSRHEQLDAQRRRERVALLHDEVAAKREQKASQTGS